MKTELQELYKKTEAELKNVLDKTITMLEYLAERNCKRVNNYEQCRLDKQEIVKLIIIETRSIINSENIVEKIKTGSITGSPEQDLKYILLFLNDLTRNPEAFSKETSGVIRNLINQLVEHFDEIWNSIKITLFNETEIAIKIIRTDITNLLVQTVNNLGDVLNFAELDGVLEGEAKVNEDT